MHSDFPDYLCLKCRSGFTLHEDVSEMSFNLAYSSGIFKPAYSHRKPKRHSNDDALVDRLWPASTCICILNTLKQTNKRTLYKLIFSDQGTNNIE